MFRKYFPIFTCAVLVIGIISCIALTASAIASSKKVFNVGTSPYVGWMPYYYMKNFGIMDKWAKKYGIKVNIKIYSKYMDSVGAFTTGALDACTMTNMEALDNPAAAGVDCVSLITGDYSNGNDGVLVKDGLTLRDLVERQIPVLMEEGSVSQYLIARACEMNGLDETKIRVVNTSYDNLVVAFENDPNIKACVTWNPGLMNLAQLSSVSSIFNSSQIPGEILDLMVANTKVVKENPDFGKALMGALYETTALMTARTPKGKAALEYMAKESPCTLEEYRAQLATTMMFYTPDAGVEYTSGEEMKKNMDLVRKFCASHGLLQGTTDANTVGIQFPDGSVLGDRSNVKLRFSTEFMQMTKDGKL